VYLLDQKLPVDVPRVRDLAWTIHELGAGAPVSCEICQSECFVQHDGQQKSAV